MDDEARRQRLLQLSAAGVFLAIIVVVVVIVVAGSGGGSSSSTPLTTTTAGKGKNKKSGIPGKAEVEKLLAGIPQKGMLLGKAGAPVEVAEFGDLQCPFCKENAENVTPGVIENQIRKGEAKISFNQFIIIGPDSIPAGEAALAAGAQNKAWNFVELWYRNQGEENSGYVTEKFIETIGKEAGVPDLAKWNKERKSGKYKKVLEAQTKEAEKLEFGGTPSFAIKTSKSKTREAISTPESSEQLEEEIEEAS
jgi:protein-disulfide isomerase